MAVDCLAPRRACPHGFWHAPAAPAHPLCLVSAISLPDLSVEFSLALLFSVCKDLVVVVYARNQHAGRCHEPTSIIERERRS